MKQKPAAHILTDIFTSLLLALVLIISAFFIFSMLSHKLWIIVAWPATVFGCWQDGAVYRSVATALFGYQGQGPIHVAEFITILGFWWPTFYVLIFVYKKYRNTNQNKKGNQ